MKNFSKTINSTKNVKKHNTAIIRDQLEDLWQVSNYVIEYIIKEGWYEFQYFQKFTFGMIKCRHRPREKLWQFYYILIDCNMAYGNVMSKY